MTPELGHSAQFLKKRKSLLLIPALIIPFLYLFFYSLGVGGAKPLTAADKGHTGFNFELPKPQFKKEKKEPNKLEVYRKADADSLKKKEAARNIPLLSSPDPKAAELLGKLDQLSQSISQPASPAAGSPTLRPAYATVSQNNAQQDMAERNNTEQPSAADLHRLRQALQSIHTTGVQEEDPQLQQLNTLLNKIIRIQHPDEDSAVVEPGSSNAGPAITNTHRPAGADSKDAGPADSSSNAIAATIPETQTLVAGATIALRLTAAAHIAGISIPNGQLVYGVVSINNDRMLINIRSIRTGNSIYPTDLQVYDMDGLPGIHIPGTLNRDVAKQSADQGIGSINLSNFDPSLAGQATNAGIQTARTLLSRKVKLIRVSVRAGYQVLLFQGKAVPALKPAAPAEENVHISVPDNSLLKPFLHQSTGAEKIQLTLQGIYLQQNILWFSLLLHNEGPIDYLPEAVRWSIRDRHRFKRSAIQELSLSTVYAPTPVILAGHSNNGLLIGFRPFALAKDKELVLEMGEHSGARVLTMVIGHREILKAKSNL